MYSQALFYTLPIKKLSVLFGAMLFTQYFTLLPVGDVSGHQAIAQ